MCNPCHTLPEQILRLKSNKWRTLEYILISGTHWFQKSNRSKYSPSSFSKVTSMPCEMLSKTKTEWKVIKSRWFWNSGFGDIEITSKPQQPQNLPSGFYFELHFWNQWLALIKMSCRLSWETFIFQIFNIQIWENSQNDDFFTQDGQKLSFFKFAQLCQQSLPSQLDINHMI